MICKFCGNDRKLIKAHIVPEGLFRRLRRGPGSLKLISNVPGAYQKNRQIGVYDKNIVCAQCEALWATWDDYAQRLLADKPLNSEIRCHKGETMAYIVRDFDYDKLKLFFISMLWRASASTQTFFSKIALGPFEATAKQFISNADPGGTEDFAVALAKFDGALAKAILDPDKKYFSGVMYYRFYIADYVAYIKIDRKPCPPPFSYFSISPNKPLAIICRDFRKSGEFPLIRKLIAG